jgi:hypothetical protein
MKNAFQDMFTFLASKAKDEDIRNMIISFRGSAKINGQTADGKAPKAIRNALTWIGNAAMEKGETELAQTAREMRDENSKYIATEYD